MHDPPGALEVLQGIQSLGAVITLDDFGTGFSSLSKLSEFPFNRIKIDKRFGHLLGEDANAQAVVLAILTLARNLHVEVIAEGVETEAQLAFLQEKGCSFVQGYHLGRPAAQASAFTAVTPGGPPGVTPPGGMPFKPSLVETHR
jgi:EAL domain-containing protein (putative c-di-GMP-specific phosphodiesterase class I)